MSLSRKSCRAEWLIVVLALALRIAWAIWIPIQPVSDSAAYIEGARSIAAGDGYAFASGVHTAYWPVGTSALYALSFIVDDGYTAAAVLNVILGTVLVALTMTVARQWFDRPASLVAGLLTALWPLGIQFSTLIASETPYLVATLAGIALWQWRTRPCIMRISLAAIAFALAAYIRPTALLIPVVLAVGDVVHTRRLVGPALHAGVALLIIAAAVTPWSIRNTQLFGRFTLISTNGGANLWMGNNPDALGHYMPLPDEPELKAMNEAQRDKELAARAKQFIRDNPARFARLFFVKQRITHDRETIGVAWNEPALTERTSPTVFKLIKWGGQLYWLLLLAGGIIGAALLILRAPLKGITHPAVANWGYYALIYGITVAQDRYHMAFSPMILALAAFAMARLWARKQDTPPTPEPAS